jgi:acyl-CoA reductase-like NAD-dependent aldehyde dehydrogenase
MTGDPVSDERRTTIDGVSVPCDHLIDGKRVGGGEKYAILSPVDGSHLGDIPNGDAAVVDAAVAAARRAFPAWAALGPDGRGDILGRFAQAILDRAHDLVMVDTADNGSVRSAMMNIGTGRSAQNIKYFADLARTLEHPPIGGPVADNSVRYDPSGVAALIVPWNAPLMLGTWKIGPALAAGCTVVVKPPEWAPFSLSLLGEIVTEAGLPDGVVNIVHGVGERTGAALVAHASVARISFTGSPETARAISAAAAANLTPLSFELGGKSPFIVFEDADLDGAVRTAAAQFMNAGQVCLAGTRLLVQDTISDRFADAVRRAAAKLVVGDPRVEGTNLGPLIHPDHFERVAGFVERALAAGAKPLVGGKPSRLGGNWFEPTILADVEQSSEIVQQEVFGPVLTLQTFRTEDEAVQLANGTDYGLAATLFTGDEARAERVASKLVAGTVWTNCFYVRDLAAPFGGSRKSGVGREGGAWSFAFFCDVKNIAVRRGSFTS